MKRRFTTNRIELCIQHHELASRAQRLCISSYCQAVKKEIVSGQSKQCKIRGEFKNPCKAKKNTLENLSKDYLLKFLLRGVANIEEFNVVEGDGANLMFTGIFHLRENHSEDYLFNLNNWPLGVEKLEIYE